MPFTITQDEAKALHRYLSMGVDALCAHEMDLMVLLKHRLDDVMGGRELPPSKGRSSLRKRLDKWEQAVEAQRK